MKRKKIQNIIFHIADNADSESTADKINDFYIDIIRRRLLGNNYTKAQRIKIIDGLTEKIKMRFVKNS